MDYRITGLSPEPLQRLYGMSDAELAAEGVRRVAVDASPGFPDRIEMREAAVGETVLLLNHLCHDAETPYRATHAIYVREGATETWDRVNEIPPVMRARLLSLRAYDAEGMMIDAEVVEGAVMEPVLRRMLSDAAVDHVDVHNAKRGCFSGRARRA